jgi:acetate kinase
VERKLVAELRCPSGAVHPSDQLQGFLAQNRLALPSVVAHRVVHGGAEMVLPCVIDARVEAEIERQMPLAPLHNSAALAWIRASRQLLGPAIPQVAIVDTAFYVGLPLAAATYALPRDLAKAHEIRRFGFHGVAHQAMLEYWSMHGQSVPAAARVISLQLWAGCSIAVPGRAGRSRPPWATHRSMAS